MVSLVIACGIRGIRRMQSNSYAEMEMIRLFRPEWWTKKKRRQKANAESLLKEIVSSITDSLVVAFFVR